MKESDTLQRLVTSNVCEVAHLLSCRHRIIEVTVGKSVPYDILELSVMMEGNNIQLDRGWFLRTEMKIGSRALETAFTAILNAAYLQEERGERL